MRYKRSLLQLLGLGQDVVDVLDMDRPLSRHRVLKPSELLASEQHLETCQRGRLPVLDPYKHDHTRLGVRWRASDEPVECTAAGPFEVGNIARQQPPELRRLSILPPRGLGSALTLAPRGEVVDVRLQALRSRRFQSVWLRGADVLRLGWRIHHQP